MRSFLVVCLAAACGHPHIDPHSAGTLDHEHAYREHASASEAHAQQAEAACRSGRPICWTTPATGPHADEARRHEELSVEHGVAGAELADEQRQACARVDDADRELGAFGHADDIASVDPIANGPRLRGVRITFRAVPGLTEQRLRDLVDCERAELAALGHPSSSQSPLASRGARATIVTGTTLTVDIVTDDPDEAARILARARSLHH